MVNDAYEKDRERTRRRVTQLSQLLDSAVRIPGTSITVGVDAVLGLIPVAGDGLSLAISGYIIWEAWRLGLPKRSLAMMGANVLLDAAVGSVPVVGDVLDVFFRANLRNLKIIKEHQQREQQRGQSGDAQGETASTVGVVSASC